MKWVATIWNALPRGLKIVVGIAIVAAAIVVSSIFSVFLWNTGYIQQKYGLATRQDVQQVVGAVEQGTATIRNTTAQQVVDQAMQAEHHRQDTLYARIDEALIQPGIQRLATVEQRVGRMETYMDRLNAKLETQGLGIGQVQDMLTTQDNGNDEMRRLLQEALEKLDQQAPPASEPDRVSPKRIKL